jgi:catechol 2,3-dioxygenase-like lactoylglutathione lyase family enzyme
MKGVADMLDHIGLQVSNYQASKAFFMTALAPLGYRLMAEFGEAAGFGAEDHPDFWIAQGDSPLPRVHVAFSGQDQAAVDRFFQAAMEADGTDNGGPGLRPDYGPGYYAAYVLDPDGNNIEAVCHQAV